MPRLLTVSLALVLWLTPTVGFSWSGYNNFIPTSLTVYQASQTTTPGALIIFVPGSASSGADTEGCTYSGKGYAWIDWSSTVQPDGKALYASVIAAFMAGKQIGFGINGCNSAGYPLVYGINVYP